MPAQKTSSPPDYMRLLPDEHARTAARLEFLARRFMEGGMSGRHRSPQKGFSTEFAAHRLYVPGDDLRALDWRVYGRTDRYCIKEFTEETNLRATILLDASASMRYTGTKATSLDGQCLSKFDCARHLAAMLTYLLIRQQDAVGLATFDKSLRCYLPPRSHGAQMRRILSQMSETKPEGESALAPVLHEIAERIPKRGLVILISDLFDDLDAIIQALHHFHFNRNELLVLHVMADEELNLPFSRFCEFRDMEGVAEPLAVNPTALRAQYMEQVELFIDTLNRECGRMQADYVPVNTRDDVSDTLAGYIMRRHRGKK